MVSIEFPIVCDREEHFKPDEIRAFVFAVTEYDNPIAPDCEEYAKLEFNKLAHSAGEKMRNTLKIEAKEKNLGNKTGEFVNGKIKEIREEFFEKYKTEIPKRTKQLEVLIPEAIKRSKKLSNLQTCSDDANRMTRFLTETIGVKPEHIILMMTEPVFNKVVQNVKLDKEETKDAR